MKPERIQVFGQGGFFALLLEVVFRFSTHDDAADFSKAARRLVEARGFSVALSIDEHHTVQVRIRLEDKAELAAVEQELVEKLSIAYDILGPANAV